MNKIAKEFMVQPIASDVDRAVGQRIQQKRKELGYTAEKRRYFSTTTFSL